MVGLRFANFVCLALMVWAAWWLARRIAGPIAATLAAPAVALFPLGFYTAGAFYPQALGGALVMGGLVALVQIPGARHPYRLAAAAGLAFGALLVTIPPLATVLIVGVVWLAFTDRRVRTVLLVLGLAALIPLGWTARNLVVMHEPVLGSTNNGLNLLLGNSPDAAPRKGVATNTTPFEDVADALGYTDDPAHEVQRDAYLRDQAIDWIKAHPGDAAVLYVGKTVNYFTPFDQLGTESENSVAPAGARQRCLPAAAGPVRAAHLPLAPGTAGCHRAAAHHPLPGRRAGHGRVRDPGALPGAARAAADHRGGRPRWPVGSSAERPP